MTLWRPVIEFACEVWDPYLVKYQAQLDNVQRRPVRFIIGLRGVESVTKAARVSLLMKIIGDDRHSSLVDCFDSLSKAQAYRP